MKPLEILQGHCLERLRELPDESVQCCVTSPPYWGLRDYGVDGQIGLEGTVEEYVANLVDVFAQVRRVLRTDGTLWLNMGDSYVSAPQGPDMSSCGLEGSPNRREVRISNASFRRDRAEVGNVKHRPAGGLRPKNLVGSPWRVAFALQADGWYLRCDIIWHKPNPMPESVADRPTKAHEYLFLLSKSERYYYNAEAIMERCTNGHARLPGNVRPDKGAAAYLNGDGKHRTKVGLLANAKRLKSSVAGYAVKNNVSFNEAMAVMPMSRNKRTVWSIGSEAYPEAHFATFPAALVKPCVLAGTRPGDVVLDPFGGSGTTGQVALELGRRAILIELNPDYVGLARARCDVTPGLALP